MRHPFFILIFVLLLTACGHSAEKSGSDTSAPDTIPMMVMQIQKCSRLYTSEYRLHKIVTFDDTMSVGGTLMNHRFKINLPVGKRRIAIPVTATVKASVDFSQFSEQNVRRHGDKIEIILPDPEVTLTATQIDHAEVRQKVSLLRSRFSDEEITRIQRQGRQDIINQLPRLDILENARQSAARQLIPIIEQMGYRQENITITFRKDLHVSDLPTLIKTTEQP